MALTARHRWCMSKLVEAFSPDVDANKSQVHTVPTQTSCVTQVLSKARPLQSFFHLSLNKEEGKDWKCSKCQWYRRAVIIGRVVVLQFQHPNSLNKRVPTSLTELAFLRVSNDDIASQRQSTSSEISTCKSVSTKLIEFKPSPHGNAGSSRVVFARIHHTKGTILLSSGNAWAPSFVALAVGSSLFCNA